MQLTVLAGGFGGMRFTRALRDAVPAAKITVIANTGDDIWVQGLRVCPDLDTLMYGLGNGLDDQRGWGRTAETFTVAAELQAYGVGPAWFGLGDRDLATHLIRTQLLHAGQPLSAITQALCDRWQPGVTLVPMTDDRLETHVVIENPERTAVHFQQWWLQLKAQVPAQEFVMIGAETAAAAPGVVLAINQADAVLIAPSNPVVSVAPMRAVNEINQALLQTQAAVVGISGIIGQAPIRGMADACLRALDVEVSATGVANYYGARSTGGLLDGWVIDQRDHEQAEHIRDSGIQVAVTPTDLGDPVQARGTIHAALQLAGLSEV